MLASDAQGLFAVPGFQHGVAFHPQVITHEEAHPIFIFNHQQRL